MKKISGEMLLAIGGCCLFLSVPLLVVMSGGHEPSTDDPFLLGQYYFNQDDDPDGVYDLKKARTYYTEALRENPRGYLSGWHQLGRIDFIEGRFDAAIYKFNKQIEYFEDEVPNVYYMLGLTYAYKAQQTEREDDWKGAEENFRTYLEHDPTSSWARTDLSWVYFSQGKYDEMLPVLEKGLADHPDHPWLLNMYGLALLNTERKDESQEYFTRALEEAEKLTVTEWGKAYPGNNPADWPAGLASFRAAIQKNIDITSN